MINEIIVHESNFTQPAEFEPVIDLVKNALQSEHSRRAYGRTIQDFLAWWDGQGRQKISKALVQSYRVELERRGLAPSTISQRITAIRKLAAEAADNGLLDQDTALQIARVEGAGSSGVRSGNWLTLDQAQELLNAPDISRIGGLRDRAILAVLLGCGLRRFEVAANLTIDQIQQREGRWVIIDLVGKRKRKRDVPMPSWCKAAIDAWTSAAGITTGRVFRGIYHYGKQIRPGSEGISAQAIFNLVSSYASKTGLAVAPHDLRRTFAKLAHKGGAPVEQIQLSLGHSSLTTTEKYLGLRQDLTDAPCDRLGLRLEQ